MIIIMVPLQAGSLLDALHSRAPPGAHHPVRLDWVARVRIAAQVARGLDELHEADLTHGAVRAKSLLDTGYMFCIIRLTAGLCAGAICSESQAEYHTQGAVPKRLAFPGCLCSPHCPLQCVLCRSRDQVTLERRRLLASRQVPTTLAMCPAVLLELPPKGTPAAKQGCWTATDDRVSQHSCLRQVRPSMVLLQQPLDGMGGAAAQLATAPAAACLCGLHMVCSNTSIKQGAMAKHHRGCDRKKTYST